MKYVDWDHDRLDIEWDVPKYDGGAKITHYTVEMRLGKPGSSWEQVRRHIWPRYYRRVSDLPYAIIQPNEINCIFFDLEFISG